MTVGETTKIQFWQKVHFTLFFLFSIALFVSQTAMDVLFIFIFLSCLFSFKEFKKQFFENKLFLILGFLFLSNIALSYSVNQAWDNYAFKRLFEALWPIIVIVYVFSLSQVGQNEKIYQAMLWPLIIISSSSILLYYFSPLEIFIFQRSEKRLGGLYTDPMTWAHSYGQIFCVLFFLSLGILRLSKNRRLLWMNLCLGATIGVGLSTLLTQTRGVWLGIFFGVVIATLFLSKKIFVYLLSSAISLFWLLYFLWEQFRNRVVFTFQFENNYDSERLALWKANWEIIKDHPFFGVGWGKNNTLILDYYSKLGITQFHNTTHAHNQFIHFWAGTGIFGLIIYLFLFIYIFALLKKMMTKTEGLLKYFLVGLFAVQIEFLISGLTECNFERGRVRYILLLSWAIVLYLHSSFVGFQNEDQNQ